MGSPEVTGHVVIVLPGLVTMLVGVVVVRRGTPQAKVAELFLDGAGLVNGPRGAPAVLFVLLFFHGA